MKRLISLLLLFAMGLSLCACNINFAPIDPVPSTSEETSIDVTTPEESTADITTIQSTPEEESSTPPEQSTTPPEETSTIPVGTTTPPVGTTTPPVGTTTPPVGTTTPPVGTTTPPVGTTTPPVGTTTPPIEETTPLPSDEKITIVFYHTMGENLRYVLDKYIVEFNKLYPNITIEHKQVGGYDDVRDQIKTEITVGQQPNIAYCYSDHVAEYNVAQAVATLDDFIASMETITRADGTLEQIGLTQEQIDNFIDGFLAEGKVYGDDKMYTMPMSKSTEVLYYNKTFFETHGISVPTTWEEMEQVCEILKALDPDCIPLAYDSEANWFITMCQQYNSPYTSATGNHYLFDNETNRNFVAMFREWYQKGYIITQELYGAYTSGLFTRDPSESNNSYMCIGSSAGANYHRSSFEVGITTVPQVDPNSPKVISQGPSLCIFKDSNEAEVLASWLFVKFLTTNVDFQAEFSMTSGYIPVIESVKDHPIYANELEYANGYYGLPMLAVQVALAQANAYFTTPAFVGSAMARDQVGVLLQQCLCDSSCATSEGIKKAFENAIKECEYRYPSQNPNPPITPDEPVYDTEAAVNYVYNLYADKYVTPADFEVTSKVVINSIPYTVTWSVDTELVTIFQKDANTYIVDVDEESPFELSYVLTATVTAADGSKATRYFSLKVPYYPIWNHEEYMAAKEGEVVVVKGIVVAMNSKAAGNLRNHLFLADTKVVGGYYCYEIDLDPIADLGIEVGMIVEVSGSVAPYSGMQEIKGGTARIVDTHKRTVETLDITNRILEGESLAQYVGLPVTIKGVEIAGQELGGTSNYLKFNIGGITSYIRTHVTDFPTTLWSGYKDIIDAAHAAHYGWKANATGILVMHNNAPYLIPMSVDCFEYIEAVVKTNEEKVADTLAELKMDTTTFSYDTWISLPTSTIYSDVVITWTTDDTKGCVVDWGDGIFSLSIPYGTVTVNFTATATCGYASASKTFAVKLSQELTPISVAIELGLYMDHNTFSAEKYLVAGIVTEVYNTTYGNMRITDENGNILTIYGSYSADGTIRYDALENKPVVGDYVVLLGSVGHYNGTPQIKNACIISYTNPSKVEDIIALGSAQEHNTYTAEKYLVTGVIVEVYNTQYGNMRITDENGNILTLYGTWDSIGFYRYDSMRVQPVAGDIITVYGLVGQYNGTPQIKNGWIVAHETATPDIPEEPIPEEQTLTIAEAIALGTSQDHNTYTAEKYYVTGVITEVYNTIYGNMYIKDEDGNILTLYGTYDETGANRYDAMDVKPVAGDIITVYGMIGQYNGTPQIKNGWIVAHLIAEAIERTDPCVSDLSA